MLHHACTNDGTMSVSWVWHLLLYISYTNICCPYVHYTRIRKISHCSGSTLCIIGLYRIVGMIIVLVLVILFVV